MKTALARELREELGIETNIENPVHVAWYESSGGLSIVVFFNTSQQENSPEAKPMNGELVKIEWIDPSQAGEYLHADDFNLVAVERSMSSR